jgi:hemerythrin-like domain-containing protein
MQSTESLKAEHRGIERMLRILDRVSDRLEAGEFVEGADLASIVEFIQVFADQCHHAKEEDLLFVALERVGIPRQGGPIGVMLHEHTMGRRYVQGMAQAATAYQAGDYSAGPRFAENARGYVALLRDHINKEDNVLYPIADARLGPEEDEALVEGFERIEEEQIGEGRHEEFHELLDRLEDIYVSQPQS